MMNRFDYNVHSRIKIRSDIDLQLNYFRVENMIRPIDLSVKIVGGIGNFSDTRYISQLDKVCANYFGLKDQHIVYRLIRTFPLRSEILLKDLLGETMLLVTKGFYITRYALDFSPLLYGSSLPQAILRIKMLLKKLLLLHSACISPRDTNEGILLVAYPEIGKTTTVLKAIKTGLFEYLSDDEIIVDNNVVAYAYPKVFNIRNLKYAGFQDRFSLRKEIGSAFLSVIPWPFNTYLAHMEHVNVRDFISVRESVPINYVFILEHGEETCERLSGEQCIRKLWLSNQRQYGYFPEILNVYAYLNDDFDIKELFSKENDILSRIVDKSECFILRAKDPQRFVKILIERFFK